MAKRSPTRSSWDAMRQRCYQKSARSYKSYGGKGVIVCERWHKYENFVFDMGERPEGRTLDRINPCGNYEPENCRWATDSEQRANKRPLSTLVGKVFGRLTVIEESAKHGHDRRWKCACICGGEKVIVQTSLKGGITNSCGCIGRELFGPNWTANDLRFRTVK